MAFKQSDVEDLLVACHRRCCLCHRWCGVKIELAHIVARADTNDDAIENAIPLCFDCHAEVGHYSKDHPRGRKFTKTELKKHRDQWLEICRTKPEVFTNAAASPEIGPLQALADELEVNITISAVAADLASKRSSWASPPPFLDGEFKRAVSAGALAVLPEELRRAIIGAYVLARGVNARAPIFEGTGEDGMAARTANEQTAQARARALPPLDEAWRELRAFMVAMNEKGLAEE